MRDKIQSEWVEMSRALLSRDPQGSGRMKPGHLRKILETFCLPMSDEHFNTLVTI